MWKSKKIDVSITVFIGKSRLRLRTERDFKLMASKTLLILLLLSVCNVFYSSQFAFNLENDDGNDYFTMQILDKYYDYILHVHFDNTTYEHVGKFVNSRKNYSMTFLRNYDGDGWIERLDGYQFLHVVIMEDPTRFLEYSNVTFNLENLDVVIYSSSVPAKRFPTNIGSCPDSTRVAA